MLCRRKCCRVIQQGEVTVEELKDKIAKGAILIDVRSRQEYAEGHLQGAINMPEYELQKRAFKELPKKNQLIVMYCQYGGRSREACKKMKQMGYTNIYNLYGGLDNI
ncbi:MAG: rhodanese-like domain-containing protein [Clostridia bacterium]|nr:rhodanese-like domain-containing protein [Clostridia bacterium]